MSDVSTKLREPFADTEVGKLPKPITKVSQGDPRYKCVKGHAEFGKASVDGVECGGKHTPSVHLDYVGHAAVTKRLLDADEGWTWEPVAWGSDGLPVMDRNGGLWIRLTVGDVTRFGYGDAQGKTGGNAVKEAIGDALRNAAMRFGVALDLWHKGDFADVPDDAPAVDWVTEARNAPSADAALHVWQMARANKAAQDVLDEISTIGTEKRQAEAQGAAGEPGSQA
jgi:hypothetical protein